MAIQSDPLPTLKLPRRPFLGLVVWATWRAPLLRPPRRRIVWIGHL